MSILNKLLKNKTTTTTTTITTTTTSNYLEDGEASANAEQ